MRYNTQKLKIIFSIIILCLLISVLIYMLNKLNFHFLEIIPLFLIIFMIHQLFKYSVYPEKKISSLLNALHMNEFENIHQIMKQQKLCKELELAFTQLISSYKLIHEQNDKHFHYLHNVIQHIGIALIAFQPNGKVELINDAAKKLFQITELSNVLFLKSFSKDFVNIILSMKSGEKSILKVQKPENNYQLTIYATEFQIIGKKITIVSIQNILSELEEQEMEAWQKLIRVLAHEIMNSISPISSLSSTINSVLSKISSALQKKEYSSIKPETMSDISAALATIEKRSKGLIHFVNLYRDFTNIPQPVFKKFMIKNFFIHIKHLMNKDMLKESIICEIKINPEDIELFADEHLIEQVLINLIKNSIIALKERSDKKISIESYLNSLGQIIIEVCDNGHGITQDTMEKIFIPFFTTQTNGSGIGLSISRQIIKMHGASLTVKSIPEKKTEFTITF